MSKQHFMPGKPVDFLTADEVHNIIEQFYRRGYAERVKEATTGKTDATGAFAAPLVLYEVPAGMQFRLNRVLVEADSYTFAALFTNPNGAILITRDEKVVDGVNLQNGLPNVWNEGLSSCIYFRNLQKVGVQLIGGPPSMGITVTIEGDLLPLAAKETT